MDKMTVGELLDYLQHTNRDWPVVIQGPLASDTTLFVNNLNVTSDQGGVPTADPDNDVEVVIFWELEDAHVVSPGD